MTYIPRHMKGVCLTHHGGPEALSWREDIPVPQPAEGQVLVRVRAAGINNTDINTRTGWYSSCVSGPTNEAQAPASADDGGWGGALSFPRIQGGDFCGEVAARGAGTTLPLGTRVTAPLCLDRATPEAPSACIVLGSERDGAFAQYCLMEEADLHDVSASPLSDIEIAAIPCAFGTAEAMLDKADVRAGQRTLITGASGGVGLAAVELARLRGAEVVAVTAETKADIVRRQGASSTLPRSATPEADSFDVVIDVVGGPSFPALIRALKTGGHYAVAGAIAGPIVTMDLREVYLRDITLHGSTYQPPAVFERLAGLINEGRLKPLVSRTYPLHSIGQAQEDFASKRFAGKLVLLPPEDTP